MAVKGHLQVYNVVMLKPVLVSTKAAQPEYAKNIAIRECKNELDADIVAFYGGKEQVKDPVVLEVVDVESEHGDTNETETTHEETEPGDTGFDGAS